MGYLVFRRREQLIRRYGDRARQVFGSFQNQQISAEAASRRLEEIKYEGGWLGVAAQTRVYGGIIFPGFY